MADQIQTTGHRQNIVNINLSAVIHNITINSESEMNIGIYMKFIPKEEELMVVSRVSNARTRIRFGIFTSGTGCSEIRGTK